MYQNVDYAQHHLSAPPASPPSGRIHGNHSRPSRRQTNRDSCRLTNGAHYVIDTGRNGAGPSDDPLYWCNPSGRALGVAPTTETAGAHADAYLWVKRPGESDGSCDRGEPAAGRFVNQFAIELARNAGQ